MNPVIQMCQEFILDNYDNLKKDYNKLSEEDKKKVKFTIFSIQVFDKVFSQVNKETNEKLLKAKEQAEKESSRIITLP